MTKGVLVRLSCRCLPYFPLPHSTTKGMTNHWLKPRFNNHDKVSTFTNGGPRLMWLTSCLRRRTLNSRTQRSATGAPMRTNVAAPRSSSQLHPSHWHLHQMQLGHELLNLHLLRCHLLLAEVVTPALCQVLLIERLQLFSSRRRSRHG